MTDKKVEFWRDPVMDTLIEDIIDIFTKLEGVELVRLSGMTIRARNLTGKHDIPPQTIDSIIRKLNSHNVINYHYITKCPHCGEISYQVKLPEDNNRTLKMCDSCRSFYSLSEGTTLEK